MARRSVKVLCYQSIGAESKPRCPVKEGMQEESLKGQPVLTETVFNFCQSREWGRVGRWVGVLGGCEKQSHNPA